MLVVGKEICKLRAKFVYVQNSLPVCFTKKLREMRWHYIYFAGRTQPWLGEIGSEEKSDSAAAGPTHKQTPNPPHLFLFSVHSDEHAAHLSTHKLPADAFFFHFSPMLFFKFANEARTRRTTCSCNILPWMYVQKAFQLNA
jgi:hypothetical protein